MAVGSGNQACKLLGRIGTAPAELEEEREGMLRELSALQGAAQMEREARAAGAAVGAAMVLPYSCCSQPASA